MKNTRQPQRKGLKYQDSTPVKSAANYTLQSQIYMLMINEKIYRANLALLLVLVLLFLVLSLPISAQTTSSDYEKSIKKINGEIRKVTDNLNANKAIRDNEQDELLAAEKSLNTLSKQLAEQTSELEQVSNRQDQLVKDLDQKQESAEQTRLGLVSLLRNRYVNGEVNYLMSVLNQENPYALGRFQHYQSYYQAALKDRFQAVTRDMQGVLALQAELADQAQAISTKQTKLKDLRAQQTQQNQQRALSIARLDAKIKDAESSLKTLQANRGRLEGLLKNLQEQAKKLRELERARPASPTKPRTIIPGGFAKQKGRLHCPLATKPKRRFGARLAESGMRSEGLFYNTDGSQAVKSIFRGQVLFADFLKGYGLLIIVDHGDDHISLYGHNATLTKNVGDSVETNEVIAQTGVTGGLKSHGLYFEIRNNARPVNPQDWCR